MKTVIASEGQSLIDIAAQELGSVEAVLDLAILNDLSITDPLSPGQVIQIGDSKMIDPELVAEFKRRGVMINNYNLPEVATGDVPAGILWVDGNGDYVVDGDGSFIKTE